MIVWMRWLTALAVVAVLGGVGVRYGIDAWHHESTDDAFIDASVVTVAPQVPGRVLRVAVSDNQRVAEGDLLVAIDAADLQVALDAARAQRARAAAELDQAKARLDVSEATVAQVGADIDVAQADAANANADLERYRAVDRAAVSRQAVGAAETDAKRRAAQLAVARKAHAAAEAERELARVQIGIAEAELASAEVEVRRRELDVSYAEIRAPRAGRIAHKGVVGGDYVEPGQALMALVGDDLWVTANFKETQLAHMRAGQPVALHVDAYPDHALRGHVDSIQAGSAALFSLLPPENATGNYVKVVQRVPVKIAIDEPTDALPALAPGLSVLPTVEVR